MKNVFRFKVVGPISDKAKKKLDDMMKKQKERLDKLAEDFKTGKIKLPENK